MENQNATMKSSSRALNARIQRRKDEIHAYGCCVLIHKIAGEMWVRHLATGWRSYARFIPGDLESIADAWETCLDIAQGMDADYSVGKI